ncbi:Osmotically-inducible protein OsmY, contains BON domain [Rhizobiales bacterium GAS113]|nr:Osmotically-inducible protein OsmY, contains BON domain [Rhizobiales bacterium GAS113]
MVNDKQLQQAVLDELAWTPAVTSSHIGVSANNGIVTLSGHVPSYWEKRAAEEATQKVKGVKAVAEEINVQLSSDGMLSDETIAERALSCLASDVSVPSDSVKVKVERGWVTLTGEVDWNYQKIAAEHGVHKIIGLIGLANKITVKPHVQPYEVRAKITKALERTAPFDVKNITIKADGGKVTLGGEVENRYEHDLVVNAAWAVPGVTQVNDHLNITWG